jgi:hypothetical protein
MLRMLPVGIATAMSIILMEIRVDRQSATQTLDGPVQEDTQDVENNYH